MKQKRGYSREFPTGRGRNLTIQVDYVPRALKHTAKAKAREAGVSLRVLILRWLTNWAAGRRPDEDAKEAPLV